MSTLITFDTTHHALWAEQVAQDAGFAVQVVSAPKSSDSQCGMALETLPDQLEQICRLFDASGIVYRLHAPAD